MKQTSTSLWKTAGYLCITFFLLLLVTSCSKQQFQPVFEASYWTPDFVDDSEMQSLKSALYTHIEYLHSLPQDEIVQIGEDSYSNRWLAHSAQYLLIRLEEGMNSSTLAEVIEDEFNIYQAGGRNQEQLKEMLITAYYEPLFKGSLTKTETYSYPVYGIPDDIIIRKLDGKQSISRVGNGYDLVPYWSREEIETDNRLEGQELVYLQDPFDVYTLHIQGSGKIELPDGSIGSLHYAGSNGRTYNSIGKLLVDEGKMTLKEASMPKIRQYLKTHPMERDRILFHNPRYIFFSWNEKAHPPVGSTGAKLTAGRSVAIDHTTLPGQAIGFVITRIPKFNNTGSVQSWKPLTRFVLAQDSGSAIQGAGRLDLFLGNSNYARDAAGIMKESGELYFFVKKGYTLE